MENTSINLYCIDFLIVIKKLQKNRLKRLLHRLNIFYNIYYFNVFE